jgi:hypothetical protein
VFEERKEKKARGEEMMERRIFCLVWIIGLERVGDESH